MEYSVFDDMAECTAAEVARLLPQVSAQRREQALRYSHTLGQYTCLKSYCMLVELLRKHGFLQAGELPDFAYNEYGKPYIEGGTEFSISPGCHRPAGNRGRYRVYSFCRRGIDPPYNE